MQLAVISDIHANLEAFKAVLADIDGRGVSNILCLGDCVGYGADPEAVVHLMRERSIPSVMGNHEEVLADWDRLDSFNPFAQEAVRQTMSMLGPEALAWINDLPRFMVLRNMRLVHGFPPEHVSTYLFQLTRDEMAAGMRSTPEPLVFVGHTHELELVSLGAGGVRRERLKDCVLPRGERHVVNAGSVGQPRDGDVRAKYVLFDESLRRITVRKVPYDNKTAAEKIRKAGMPGSYARRLLG